MLPFIICALLWSMLYRIVKCRAITTQHLEWEAQHPQIISNTISFIHASLISILTGISIFISHDWNWNDEYTLYQKYIVYLSVGYFIYDLYHVIYKNPSSIFIMHHLVAIIGGYLSVTQNCLSKLLLYSLFLGEITNPCQIIWYISKKTKKTRVEQLIFPIYVFNFIVIRSIIIPYYMLQTLWYLSTSQQINIYIIIIFSCASMAILGSMIWIKKLITIIKLKFD